MNDLADRRREEKERRRDEILDAAAAVVAEIGFDKLTMGLVAQVVRQVLMLVVLAVQPLIHTQTLQIFQLL